MPSKVCCGVSCPVTRSPSCECMHRQTGKPLQPPTCVFSSTTYLFGWTDHGDVTASNGANTTRMRSQQGQKGPNKRAFWTLPFGTIWKSFLLCKRLPEGRQKNLEHFLKEIVFSYGCKIQRVIKSDRPEPVPGSFRQICTHAMIWNRDHLCESPHVVVQAIIYNTQKKHHEQTITQTILEKSSHGKGVVGTVYMTVFQKLSRQYSNNFQHNN